MIEHGRGQPRLGDHGDIDIAVAPAEATMGKAAHEIDPEQLWPELGMPQGGDAIGKTDRRNAGGTIHHLIHGAVVSPQLFVPTEPTLPFRSTRVDSGLANDRSVFLMVVDDQLAK